MRKARQGLGKNTTWTNLEKLILNENKLGDKGSRMIGSNVVWTNLKHLDLSNNKIGEEDGTAIGKNNNFFTTTKLEIKQLLP